MSEYLTSVTAQKIGVVTPIPFLFTSEYKRRGHSAPREIPADEQARYEAALAGYAALEAYEHTEWGGPDYGTEVLPPPDTEWVWDETEEEYQARIEEMGS